MAKVAALVGPEFEDSELSHPMKALKDAGHEIELLGTEANQALEGKRGEAKVTTDAAVGERSARDYDALLIPGGHSPDKLRLDEDMVSFVKQFDATGRPMFVICHGPQLLIEAGVVKGRTMTSWPSVRTDLKNAGATVVDEDLCEDGNLITSREPGDLEAFSKALVSRLNQAAAAK